MTDREEVINGLEQFISDFRPFVGDKVDWQRVDDALVLLKAQEPRVLTLEEFMAHWKLPFKERPPIWEEWKIDEGKGRWKLYGRATGGYGTLWRCWTARPTEEQREAVPWES